ncbi:MerR family transcriptional regulator [Rhodobacter sp. SGA-6-6]|uniref:MerR family transcriptional regulator n=1 Tax=Rhodobacter sp. SGA-6-6 TaxID=2710882 RepID=UPI0013EB0A17|nr:MerR family transcriptional regulator [Rhodobacter sp. SGA-6-6]NGM47227.1 MerR family transcriptional regulator [Rhodobacter sp. SGA-6-6]
MDKSPEAFRTISEVAEALETPAHVLRFWESRFPQIRPVKRAGGRRYYRPSDVALLTGIKRLLHDEGMTIRGVQKILREQGIRHVSGLSEETSAEEEALEAAMAGRYDDEPKLPPERVEEETAAALEAALDDTRGVVLPFAPVAEPAAEAPAEEAVAELQVPEAPAAVPNESPVAAEAPPEVEVASPAEPPPQRDFFDPPPAPRPADSPAPAAAEASATLAARLRALPRGSLAPRAEALAGIADRIAALRGRMAGQPPQG